MNTTDVAAVLAEWSGETAEDVAQTIEDGALAEWLSLYPPASATRAVTGSCPMGCGATLFAGQGGHITCSYLGCPDPCAVDTILGDRETEHLVTFTAEEFTIRHPLRERLGNALLTCALHAEIAGMNGPPVVPGTYRCVDHRSGRTWQPVPDKAPALPEGGER